MDPVTVVCELEAILGDAASVWDQSDMPVLCAIVLQFNWPYARCIQASRFSMKA